ncbi:MAG: helix-hairpin-helix domain-containing protein [Thiolinea sp.]
MRKLLSSILLTASVLAAPALWADMVNINKATAAAIQHNLKGVGEKKAQAIVDYREEHGAFKTLEEIKEVKGIGDGIFAKIKADISLTEGVTDLEGSAGSEGLPGKAADMAKDKAQDKAKAADMKPEAGKSEEKKTNGKDKTAG